MRRLTPLVLVLLAGCPAGPPSDAGGPPAEAGPTSAPTASASPAGSAEALAAAVARAAGLEAWAQVGTLRFTFHFPAKGIQRSYAWDVARGQVEVQADPAQDAWVSVPVAGFGPGDTPTPDRLQAHKTFVNDGFWALPCLHLAWDRGRTVEDLGTVAVPTLPALGKRRALALRYDVQAGGYTPGDHYVFYLGDDDYPLAWAFHRQGSAEPTFVAEWRDARAVGGLRIVSQYLADGGALDLRIEDVTVTPAGGAPSEEPTSRPTGGE